ncbi:MAG: hypothetical protein ACLPN6_23575 [Streptosporangiaceae bacterium]|jgi:hypothetical protein|nr:hypothetical protein [Actinomycetota bacterium]
MSFLDRLIIWLHIAFAVFTVGPVTAAIMSTPRYVRARNVVVVRYLYRVTRIFALGSLAVLIFGIIAAQQQKELSKPWLTASMTLFVVGLVLLVLIIRDQRKAIGALETAAAAEAPAAPVSTPVAAMDTSDAAVDAAHAAGAPEPAAPGSAGRARHVATVERGRIASLGGVLGLIWLAILVLMVWHG